jgi:hypothetical protein
MCDAAKQLVGTQRYDRLCGSVRCIPQQLDAAPVQRLSAPTSKYPLASFHLARRFAPTHLGKMISCQTAVKQHVPPVVPPRR